MDIKSLSPEQAIEAVSPIEDKEQLRAIANAYEVSFSGNSGADTIKANIITHLQSLMLDDGPTEADGFDLGGHDEEIEIAKAPAKPKHTIEELLAMDAKWVEDPAVRRQVIRAKALKVTRVMITSLDPGDAQLNGAIISVTNKYTGKVSKYIPFGDDGESGYHVPEMLLNFLRNQKFVLRREVKGGQFGVKKYKTSHVNKFSIQELPHLSRAELADLASHQRASGAIDKAA
jgi:hypothetical protein